MSAESYQSATKSISNAKTPSEGTVPPLHHYNSTTTITTLPQHYITITTAIGLGIVMVICNSVVVVITAIPQITDDF